MELITIYQDSSLQIIICRLAEDLQHIDFLTETEFDEFSALQHLHRKKEYLTIRYILREIGITDSIIYAGRKPQLPEDLYLSISHNKNYAGLAISKFPCGFDIESISERAFRVRDKYLTVEEKQLAKDDIMLHNLFWSVKEAVYKWDNSHTDFRETIQILDIKSTRQTVNVKTNCGEKILNYRLIHDTDVLSWIIG
ncbi:MAG: 4'-phosphopantetheinyl transferase superfamily protein [Bacteroidales bacterium]|jgi:4'-phosphopantetheinyl transferase EntD|nr:4'-phosphopantetheinyl transferase superfamily protein [Bacteroidales bacterium]